jgi:two-component system sensor kinase FixL
VVDGLSVAGIVIDQTGKIHAFNEAAQKMLGYRLIDVVSRNLSILMPSEYARVHNDYITYAHSTSLLLPSSSSSLTHPLSSHTHTTQCSTYLKTGQAKIIGVGRDVPVVRKDGTLMGAHLTVTEKRDGEKVFFVGILQPK